ncbi:hypothetical protein BpHYR1_005014 [Brachionus plicatilis]|uniref:Uncharacterized protein n=1 Tax=Brachionus plicatilis TaxID=10195 RepID=A0A3M7Q4J2_BRAPC|nr:hypothetical protein BpHYR1_005014 [Brachionus plicatilis]
MLKEKHCKNTLDLVIAESRDRIADIKTNTPLGDVKQGHMYLVFFALEHNLKFRVSTIYLGDCKEPRIASSI